MNEPKLNIFKQYKLHNFVNKAYELNAHEITKFIRKNSYIDKYSVRDFMQRLCRVENFNTESNEKIICALEEFLLIDRLRLDTTIFGEAFSLTCRTGNRDIAQYFIERSDILHPEYFTTAILTAWNRKHKNIVDDILEIPNILGKIDFKLLKINADLYDYLTALKEKEQLTQTIDSLSNSIHTSRKNIKI